MSKLRGVLDTNVVLSAHRSRNPRSAGNQLLDLCRHAWTALYSRDVLGEYVEKLLELGMEAADVENFISDLTACAEEVKIEFFHLRHYPVDQDDTAFLLCACNGTASHLATYDHHLLDLAPHYAGEFSICKPRALLEAVLTVPVPE